MQKPRARRLDFYWLFGIFLRQDANYVYLYDANIQGTNRVSYGTRWSKSNYSFQIYRANNYSQIANSGDNTAPQITNLWVTDLTNDGYTVYVTVTDNVGVDRGMFPTWTQNNGQDDIVWLAGSKQNATTWACRIFFEQRL